jgi:hypothetical protein
MTLGRVRRGKKLFRLESRDFLVRPLAEEKARPDGNAWLQERRWLATRARSCSRCSNSRTNTTNVVEEMASLEYSEFFEERVARTAAEVERGFHHVVPADSMLTRGTCGDDGAHAVSTDCVSHTLDTMVAPLRAVRGSSCRHSRA